MLNDAPPSLRTVAQCAVLIASFETNAMAILNYFSAATDFAAAARVQARMVEYYSNTPDYYSDIDYAREA